MFLDILEFQVEDKKNGLGKTVLKMWFQIRDTIIYLSKKSSFRKKYKKKYLKKNHETVNNLCPILWTKLVVLLVS